MVQSIAVRLQTCTACYCTEYCRQLWHIGNYYNIMGTPSYVRSVDDRNDVMQRMTIHLRQMRKWIQVLQFVSWLPLICVISSHLLQS